MSALALLCLSALAAVTVEIAPDRPGRFLYTDEPLVLEIESETDAEVRIQFTVDVPGQSTQHHFIGPLELTAGVPRWEPVTLEDLAGPHDFSLTLTGAGEPVSQRTQRIRLHRVAGGDSGYVALAAPDDNDDLLMCVTELAPDGVLVENGHALDADGESILMRLDLAAIEGDSTASRLVRIGTPEEGWRLAQMTRVPDLGGVVYQPVEAGDSAPWRRLHAEFGASLPHAFWRVAVNNAGNRLDVDALVMAQRAGVPPGLDLSTAEIRPELLAEWCAWTHLIRPTEFIGLAGAADDTPIPVFRGRDGEWIAVLATGAPIEPVPPHARYLDRFGNPAAAGQLDPAPRFVVSRDIDTLIEFALVGAREEATALQRFLLTTGIAEYVEANPFMGHTESGPELTRRDYFQTLTFFREILGIEGDVGSEAYFLAESRLARLARLLAIAEEDQGEPFIERVADRELRYRELIKDFEQRAGRGGARIDPPARAVFRESRDWLDRAASLEARGLINEARAMAAAAEWRARAIVERLSLYNGIPEAETEEPE